MNPSTAAQAIQNACVRRPDLKYQQWPKLTQPFDPTGEPGLSEFQGYCYIATEAFCKVIPEARPYRNEFRSHFWAQIGDEVWDLTADQFDFEWPYDEGYPTRFKRLSARAKELLDESGLSG